MALNVASSTRLTIEVSILPGCRHVLVGVDADAELAGVGGRLQHADAGGAGGGVDHVGALVDLRLGEFAARPGSFQAAGVVPVMFWKTLTFGLAALTPCT